MASYSHGFSVPSTLTVWVNKKITHQSKERQKNSLNMSNETALQDSEHATNDKGLSRRLNSLETTTIQQERGCLLAATS